MKNKIQSFNTFKTNVTKDYTLIKSLISEKDHEISILTTNLIQVNNLKSKNKSLASKCSSVATIIKASKNKSASVLSRNKSFLIGKSKKDYSGGFSSYNSE